jgi:hypothetical protein
MKKRMKKRFFDSTLHESEQCAASILLSLKCGAADAESEVKRVNVVSYCTLHTQNRHAATEKATLHSQNRHADTQQKAQGC